MNGINFDKPISKLKEGQFDKEHSQTATKTVKVIKTKWRVDSSSIGRDCASRQLNNLIGLLGTPDLLDNSEGGFATWKKRTLYKREVVYKFFDRIELWDDNAISKFPFEHYASICGYIKLEIPTERISKILSISPNISYDIITNMIKIRGRNLNDCIAITTLICMLYDGETTLDNIKEYSLVYKYITTLQNGSKNYNPNGEKSFLYRIWKTKRI
jgi:hypothetical protein